MRDSHPPQGVCLNERDPHAERDRPTFVSLFSGVGGIDLGLERAGFRCVLQVESDEFCQRVLAKHWPDVPRYGDIKLVDFSKLPKVDLLAGGFPCQPVSTAGKQRAQADDRWLWPEFFRAVRDLRPRLVLVENVPGLRSAAGGLAMAEVLGDLASLGIYDVVWDGLGAVHVRAPHRRDRVWIVAHAASSDGRWRDGDDGDGAAGRREERIPFAVGGDGRVADVPDAHGERRGGWERGAPEGGRQLREPESGLRRDAPDAQRDELRDERWRGGGAIRRRAPESGDDGAKGRVAGHVADAKRAGRETERGDGQSRQASDDAQRGGEVLADADEQRRDDGGRGAGAVLRRGPASPVVRRRRDAPDPDGESMGRVAESRSQCGSRQLESVFRRVADELSQGLDGGPWADGEWPGVPRVAVSVQDRTRRLKALGNAAVPQCVEVIGCAIRAEFFPWCDRA